MKMTMLRRFKRIKNNKKWGEMKGLNRMQAAGRKMRKKLLRVRKEKVYMVMKKNW